MPGILYVVATPIGNLEDITYRAVRVLGEVDLIAAEDTRAAQVLLDRYGVRRPLLSYFEGNETERAADLVARLGAGEHIAVISQAGTPAVSDPGYRVVVAALAAGVRVEVIPGPSAAVTALVAAGLPTDRFLFLGFPPRTEARRRELFAGVRTLEATLVLYEAPGRVGETLADLAAALGPRPAAVARELTKLYEEVVRGTLPELHARYAATPPRGEVTLVVAGAPAGAALEAEVDLTAELRAAVAAGRPLREVAAELALRTGKSRHAIYQLGVALKKG
ncbi:MAG TPA: 16S rRNA (cytidine(1402)-2'-O)-methyltransferase [Polyangia bacterium]|jgi:16S rRNA (cytidine1402-2'-O)-methyltransferase